MLSVDDRAGSSDLVPYLRARGLPVHLTRMAYGDVAFIGNGPGGIPIPIGIEVKSIRDVLSCMTNGRFSGHQLPGLIQSYTQAWLLMVGKWRSNPKSGILEYQKGNAQWCEATVGTRRFMWRDLETWLFTVKIRGGLNLHRCSDWGEAVSWISTLYQWWTSKALEDHRGHLSVHERSDLLFDRAILVRPSLCRLVAMQLPGIGVGKSAEVAAYFGSVSNMFGADISEWENIPGIGRTMAERIYRAIRSESA
jgi:ERCC4-type nuclease